MFLSSQRYRKSGGLSSAISFSSWFVIELFDSSESFFSDSDLFSFSISFSSVAFSSVFLFPSSHGSDSLVETILSGLSIFAGFVEVSYQVFDDFIATYLPVSSK